MDPNVSEITTLVEKGDLATASDLIRHFNQTAESLFPVLDVACRKGHTVMVRYLVNIGVPVDHANRDGIKPLHRAARRGDLEIVQCLIEHCENAHKNDYLNSCYMIPRITVWPFPYQWVFMSALAAAATEGHLEVVRYLVEQGADPLLKLQSNGLAVHCALRDDKDHVDVLRYLLDLNHSQLERKTADNETLLHLASRKDHVESARWLLDQGADHKAVDSEGDTPWLVATKARSAAVMGVFLGKEISSPQPLRGIWQRIGDKMKKATTYTYLFPGREQFYWGGNKLILVGGSIPSDLVAELTDI
ncbi:ankyrin repeat-containing domain protein [Xylariaceae sp. FL0016]|nr:ankyrin repeat-containing domain protein [Xylariaceae sp. FL0016]